MKLIFESGKQENTDSNVGVLDLGCTDPCETHKRFSGIRNGCEATAGPAQGDETGSAKLKDAKALSF